MAENHTVKPDGGGEYSSLALAEDDQDGDLSGRGIVAFECFDGVADLGVVTISDWTNPDASNFVRIIAPLTERTNGKDEEVGAWIKMPLDGVGVGITIEVDFTEIIGIRFMAPSGGSFSDLAAIFMTNINNILVDSCLFHVESGATLNMGILIQENAQNVSVIGPTIQNCLAYPGTAGVQAIRLSVFSFTAGTKTMTPRIYNNSFLSDGTTGIQYKETVISGDAQMTMVMTNNMFMDHSGADYDDGGGITSDTRAKNISADATGDVGLQNKLSSDQFVDNTNDFTLKSGADALNGGDVVDSFDWDALHEDGENWRPQGSATDIGALELEIEGETVKNSIMMVT